MVCSIFPAVKQSSIRLGPTLAIRAFLVFAKISTNGIDAWGHAITKTLKDR